jgi:hypothetical protein
VAAVYGDTAAEARRHALQTLEDVRAQGYTPATLRTYSRRRREWLQPDADGPCSSLERLLSMGAFQAATTAALERLTSGGVGDEEIALAAGSDGDVIVTANERPLARGRIRPAWLDGERIRGHRPELRRPGFVLPQPV